MRWRLGVLWLHCITTANDFMHDYGSQWNPQSSSTFGRDGCYKVSPSHTHKQDTITDIQCGGPFVWFIGDVMANVASVSFRGRGRLQIFPSQQEVQIWKEERKQRVRRNPPYSTPDMPTGKLAFFPQRGFSWQQEVTVKRVKRLKMFTERMKWESLGSCDPGCSPSLERLRLTPFSCTGNIWRVFIYSITLPFLSTALLLNRIKEVSLMVYWQKLFWAMATNCIDQQPQNQLGLVRNAESHTLPSTWGN